MEPPKLRLRLRVGLFVLDFSRLTRCRRLWLRALTKSKSNSSRVKRRDADDTVAWLESPGIREDWCSCRGAPPDELSEGLTGKR